MLYTLTGRCLPCTLASGCTDGQYLDAACVEPGRVADASCRGCAVGCATCSGGLPSQCLSCPEPAFVLSYTQTALGEGLCVSRCPSGSYQPVGQATCKKCDAACGSSCSGNKATDCITCPTGQVLLADSSCSDTCPAQNFHRPSRQRRGDCQLTVLLSLYSISTEVAGAVEDSGCTEAASVLIGGGRCRKRETFLPRFCSRTLMDCVAPPSSKGGRRNPSVPSRCGSPLLLLMCAFLMTSSHSEGSPEDEVVVRCVGTAMALFPKNRATVESSEFDCEVRPHWLCFLSIFRYLPSV